MENNIVSLQEVSYSYHSMTGETDTLNNITFSVKKGEFVAIVGPSGCGKSTLLSLISGLLLPESGKILFPMHTDTSKIQIGYMLQQDHLFEWRSIYKNIILGLELQHVITKKNLLEAESMMKEYGLWEFRYKKPSELSGGMRQRAALIRTLLLKPELLLLDEPFSALDYQTRLNVSSDISHIIKTQNKTAILITHDLSEAISLADRVIVLSSRPSTVVSQIPIRLTLNKGDGTLLAPRNAPEFKQYFNLLWRDLNQNVQQKSKECILIDHPGTIRKKSSQKS